MIKGQDMYFAPYPPIKIQEKNTFYLNKYARNKKHRQSQSGTAFVSGTEYARYA